MGWGKKCYQSATVYLLPKPKLFQIEPSGHNKDNPLPCHPSSSRGGILNGFPEVGVFCISIHIMGFPLDTVVYSLHCGCAYGEVR